PDSDRASDKRSRVRSRHWFPVSRWMIAFFPPSLRYIGGFRRPKMVRLGILDVGSSKMFQANHMPQPSKRRANPENSVKSGLQGDGGDFRARFPWHRFPKSCVF